MWALHPDMWALLQALHPDRALHPDMWALHPDMWALHSDMWALHPYRWALHPNLSNIRKKMLLVFLNILTWVL